MKITRNLILLIVFSLFLAACGLLKSELDTNLEKWKSQHPGHYRYDLQIGCFCAFMDKMPLSIEVENGQVVNISDATGAAPSAQEMEWYASYTTIDKIFAYAQTATTEADQVDIQYDPDFGYPTRISIDWIEQAIDDEMGLTVSNFTVIP